MNPVSHLPSHVKTEGFEGKQKQNNHKQDCLQGCILLSWWLWSQRLLRTQSQDVQKRLTAVEDVGEAICTKDKASAGGLHSVGCYRLCVSLGKCRLICMFLLLQSAVPCIFVWVEGPILTLLHGSFKFVITFSTKTSIKLLKRCQTDILRCFCRSGGVAMGNPHLREQSNNHT